jgi:hypothetical protein
VSKFEFKTIFSCENDGRRKFFRKTHKLGKLNPKEVLSTIAPLISRVRRESGVRESRGDLRQRGQK